MDIYNSASLKEYDNVSDYLDLSDNIVEKAMLHAYLFDNYDYLLNAEKLFIESTPNYYIIAISGFKILRDKHNLDFSQIETLIYHSENLIDNFNGSLDKKSIFWVASFYNSIGLYYEFHGNIRKALEYHAKSLEIREKSSQELLYPALISIAKLYMILGKFTQSRKLLNRAIQISEQPEAIIQLAFSYLYTDKYIESLELITKISSSIINEKDAAFSIFIKIYSLLKLSRLEDASKLLETLKEFNSSAVIPYQWLSNAFVLGYSKRKMYILQSQSFFEKVLNTDISFGLQLFVLLNYANLLLDEYELTNEFDSIADFNEIIKQIINFASQFQSDYLELKSILLKLKLSILTNNNEKTTELLKKINDIYDLQSFTILQNFFNKSKDKHFLDYIKSLT